MNNDTKNEGKNIVADNKRQDGNTQIIMSVEDVIDQLAKMRTKLVQKRELSQEDECKVVVTFTKIEKLLKANKPKKKKLEKNFNTLLKIFSRVRVSDTKEWIDSITSLKAGVDDLVEILCL